MRPPARGQAGTVLVLTGTGFQTPNWDKVPAAHLYHAVTALERTGPGLHRADDRRRGAVADVTPDDRALVDRFLDMMAAEAGASRHTLAAYRNDLERAAERLGALATASADDLSTAGTRLGRACALDRGAALGGAAALFRLPRR